MDRITSFHESLEKITKNYIKDKSTFINSLDISRSMFYRWLSGEQLPKEEIFNELIVLLSDHYSVKSIEIEILKMNYAIASLDELTRQKIKAADYFLNTVSNAISMSNIHTTSSFYSSSNINETIKEEPFDDTRNVVGIADVRDILLYMFKASIIDEDCYAINILAPPDEVILDTIQLGLRPYREDFIVYHFFNVYADSFLDKSVYEMLLIILNTGIMHPNYIPNVHDAIYEPEGIFNTIPYVMCTKKRLLLISANYDYAFYYYPKNNHLPLSIYKNYFNDLLEDESGSRLFLRSAIKNGAPILHKIEANSSSMNIINKAFTQFSIPLKVFDYVGINTNDKAAVKDFFGEEIVTFMMNQINALKHFYSMLECNKKAVTITLTKKGVYDFMRSGKIDEQDNIPAFNLTQRIMIIQHLIKLIETHDNYKARLLRDDRLALFLYIDNLALTNFDEHIIIWPLCNNNFNSLNNTMGTKNKFLVDAISLYFEHVILPMMDSKEETLAFLKDVIATPIQEQK